MILYYLYLGIKRCFWLKHHKSLAGTIGAIGKGIVSELIAHHLRIAFHTNYHLCLVGQHGAVEILDYGTNSINQGTVVRIYIVHMHMAVANYLKRFSNRILFTKHSFSQSLCDDALIRCIKCRIRITLNHLEVEEVEECGVNHHDDGLVISPRLNLLFAIFDTSTLAKHAAGLFYLRTHLTNLASCLRPHKEVLLIAHQIDAVRILVP